MLFTCVPCPSVEPLWSYGSRKTVPNTAEYFIKYLWINAIYATTKCCIPGETAYKVRFNILTLWFISSKNVINFVYLLLFLFAVYNSLITRHKTTNKNCFFNLFTNSLKQFSGGAARPLVATNGNRAFFIFLKMHFSSVHLSALCSYIGS